MLSLLVWLMISPEKSSRNSNRNLNAKRHQNAVKKDASENEDKLSVILKKNDSFSLSQPLSQSQKTSDRNDFLNNKKQQNTVATFSLIEKKENNHSSEINISRSKNEPEETTDFMENNLLKKTIQDALLPANFSS